MAKRIGNCKICGREFESGVTGLVAKSCPQCRGIDYKQRYSKYTRVGVKLRGIKSINFKAVLERANGCCEICRATDKKLAIHKLVKCNDLEKVRKMREGGMTFQEIANKYGVSRQRIHQLL